MNNSRGFSAIEVLIAATIVVVALLAIASMAPTAYRTVDWSGEDTMAVTLAQQRIEFLKNQPFTSAELDETTGDVTETLAGEYTGYTRETEVEDNPPVVGALTGVKQVTVTVNTPDGRQVVLVTLIAE